MLLTIHRRNDVREFTPRFTAVTTQIDDSSKSIMSAIVAERDVFEAISAFQTDKLQAFVGDKAAAIESSQEHTLHAGIEQVMSTQISISEKSANEQQQRCESILSAIETCTGQTKAQVNGTRIETRQAFGELNKSIRELQTEIAKQREMLQKCLIECASARNTATRAKTVKQSNAIVKAIAGLQDLYQSLLAISGAVNPTPELWQGPLSRQLTIPREASEKAVHRISTWLASIVTTKVTSTQNTFTLPAEVNKAENSLIELVGGISAKFELGRNVEAASVKELSI
ncbi:hypothetical protein F5Y07DRAFT_378345 [Xylaria sp. FL0933]|nr:hypothetical protein F5Y07DRAFT_378345 [Xylaria sp. FL0933]